MVCLIALADFPLAKTAEQYAQGLDIFIGQIKLGHQLFDPLRRINSRSLKLIVSPVVPSLLDIRAIAEKEFFSRLGAKGCELGADARFLFHAFNIVTTEAAPPAYQ